jgi:putative transposase
MNKKHRYNPQIHHRRSIRLKGYDYAQAGFYFITICCQDRACLFGDVVNGAMQLNDSGMMVEKWYYELENKFPHIKCHAMVVMPNHFHCIVEIVGSDKMIMPDDPVGADLCVCPNNDPCVHPKNDECVRPNNDPCIRPINANDACIRPIDSSSIHDVSNINHTVNANNVSDNNNMANTNVHNVSDNNNNMANMNNNVANMNDNNMVDTHNNMANTNNVDMANMNNYNMANTDEIEGEHIGSPLHCVVQWFKTMSTNEYIRGVKNYGWPPFDGKLWQRNYYEIIIRDQTAYDNISQYIKNNPAKWGRDKFHKYRSY